MEEIKKILQNKDFYQKRGFESKILWCNIGIKHLIKFIKEIQLCESWRFFDYETEEEYFSCVLKKIIKDVTDYKINLENFSEDCRVSNDEKVPPLKHLIILDELSKKKDIKYLSISANGIITNGYERYKLPLSTDDLFNKIENILRNNNGIENIFLYLNSDNIKACHIKKLGEILSGRTVDELSLENNSFGKLGVEELIKFLGKVCVKKLFLSKNSIGPRGCNALIDNLPKTLEFLDLTYNNIKAKDKEIIDSKLRKLKSRIII